MAGWAPRHGPGPPAGSLDNAAARKLRAYERLVNDGRWDAPEAAELKQELDSHYGDAEPKLDELALRIETMKWERGL